MILSRIRTKGTRALLLLFVATVVLGTDSEAGASKLDDLIAQTKARCTATGPGTSAERVRRDCPAARKKLHAALEKGLADELEQFDGKVAGGTLARPSILRDLASKPEQREAADTLLRAEESEKIAKKAECSASLSDRWCLEVATFAGLVRVGFADSTSASASQFSALSGVGTGLKFRFDREPTKDGRREAIGIAPFLYLEPKLDGQGGAFSRLSAGLLLSVIEHFTVGVGAVIAHNEKTADKRDVVLRGGQNVFLLIGLNLDPSALPNK